MFAWRLAAAAERRSRTVLASIIAAVVVGGCIYSLWLGHDLRYGDESEYYTLARNIVAQHEFTHDGVNPSAFRPPGYPGFLAVFLALGADIALLRMLNFLALGGCIYLLHAILREESGAIAGLTGAVVAVCYPVLFYTAGTLYPQIVGSLLLLLAFRLMLGREESSVIRHVLAGSCFGLLLLVIPSFVFTLFVMTGWMLAYPPKLRLRQLAAVVLMAGIVAGVWSIRNHLVFRAFVFGSANSGYMLLLGNSENTSPNAGPNVDISQYAGAVGNDVEVDRYYRERAIEYILTHKSAAIRMYLRKVLNYFNYRNDLATRSEMSATRDLIMLLTYVPLLLVAVARVLIARRFPLSSFEKLVLVVYVSNALYAAIFFTRVRYRLPLDFFLIMFVASSVAVALGGGARRTPV